MNSGEGLGSGGGLVDMGGFTGGNLLLAETCRTFLVEYENINLNLIYVFYLKNTKHVDDHLSSMSENQYLSDKYSQSQVPLLKYAQS